MKCSQLGSVPSRQLTERAASNTQTCEAISLLLAQCRRRLSITCCFGWRGYCSGRAQAQGPYWGLTGALLGPKSGWKVSHKEMWNKDPLKYHNDSTSLRETGWFFADDDG